MHPSVRHIHDAAQALRAEHATCDAAGKLTARTVAILRNSQGMRLLQSRQYQGFEAELTDFYEWVRTAARYNPSAGWVAGVVGVHPWEIALCHPRLQQEIYGTDSDTWVASPYAPFGKAIPTDGGYRFSGEWPYSTGTDECEWIVLGGMLADAAGNVPMPPVPYHFFLPRGDYEIVEDSWNVMGLAGTGSKNVRVNDVFVPEHRTVGHVKMCDSGYRDRQPDSPMYHLPFGAVFSGAITSATFGIAQGTIDVYREQLTTRVSVSGVAGTSDPFQQEALIEAEADLAAGIVHLDVMTRELIALAARGEVMTLDLRLEFRRNQVRAAQRVVQSVDRMLARAGSAAVWTTRPLERYWRDLRTGASHVCNVTDAIYPAWANHTFNLGKVINAFY